MNQKNRHKTKTKAVKTAKIAIALFIIAATILGAVGTTYAFSAFGYNVGTAGIQKEQYSSKTIIEQNGYMTDQDINEAVQTTNADPYTTDFMKIFSDESFCVKTEKRVAFIGVATDGSLSLIEQPSKCYELKTTEMFIAKTWAKYSNGEGISYKEISKHVKLPFAVKTKLAIAGLKN